MGVTKLTPEQIAEIRLKYGRTTERPTYDELAIVYNTNRSTIESIINGKAFRGIGDSLLCRIYARNHRYQINNRKRKLTDAQVEFIRLSLESSANLAKLYDVSTYHIYEIRRYARRF